MPAYPPVGSHVEISSTDGNAYRGRLAWYDTWRDVLEGFDDGGPFYAAQADEWRRRLAAHEVDRIAAVVEVEPAVCPGLGVPYLAAARPSELTVLAAEYAVARN